MKNDIFVLVGIAPNLITQTIHYLKKYSCRIVVIEDKQILNNYFDVLIENDVYPLFADITSTCNLRKKLKETINLEEVQAIYSFREDSLIATAELAEELGVVTLPLEVVKNTVDKVRTRNILKEQRIDCISYRLCNSEEEIRLFLKENSEGIVLKPRNLKGSIGVQIIKNDDDISNAYREISQIIDNKEILVEEELIGEEIAVELLVFYDEIFLVDITQKKLYKNSSVEQGHICPHPRTNELFIKYEKWFKKIVKALKISFGPVALEMIFSEKKYHLVEIHTRYGGDCLIPMAEKVYQTSYVEPIIRYLLGLTVNMKKDKQEKYVCEIFYLNPPLGKIINIDSFDWLRNIPFVMDFDIQLKKGDVITQVKSSIDRKGWILISGKDYSDVKNKFQMIEKKLFIEVKK